MPQVALSLRAKMRGYAGGHSSAIPQDGPISEHLSPSSEATYISAVASSVMALSKCSALIGLPKVKIKSKGALASEVAASAKGVRDRRPLRRLRRLGVGRHGNFAQHVTARAWGQHRVPGGDAPRGIVRAGLE
ncbi:hypothetical protein MRX96_036612 [Rhipicephalus microplus]